MEQKGIKWQDLEKIVRRAAEAKFGGVARAEDIAGVKCDCVIDRGDGSAVIVEITKENSIDKLRIDLAKFNMVRPHFFQRNIFPLCYFVTVGDPTPALIASGKENHVTVYSVAQFINFLFGLRTYANIRMTKPFGSAIDLYSGKPDDQEYVAVQYFSDDGTTYDVPTIARHLVSGKTIVLIGDYGSGKSRCVMQVFAELYKTVSSHYKNPVAINLRESWGLKRATEVLARHFTDIGLGNSVTDIMKVAFGPSCVYLLDGFDEMGAQTWSDDPATLVEIRKQSLIGVKDLVDQARGGILIAGREHYFNNDAELITCLGLDRKSVLFLRCNQELTQEQFSSLIGHAGLGVPAWIPKKPLIGTVIRDIPKETISKIFETSSGQIDFWELLITTFCEREARINPILDPNTIRNLYTKIGRLSRLTQSELGPISIKEINSAFEETTGRPPTDESAIILQRLPGLSRVGAESLDRIFVDSYILDGLKAQDVLEVYGGSDDNALRERWRHPLQSFGAFYLAARIESIGQVSGTVAYIKRHRNVENSVIISDMISALFMLDKESDFGGAEFKGGRFFNVSFSACPVKNINLIDCIFDEVDLTDADPHGVRVIDSIILRAAGVSSKEHVPEWMENCHVEEFQEIKTLSEIRKAGLTIAQTFLLSSLRKLFLQPGAGRKASSMYKGYGDSSTKKTCEKVIGVLLKERFCQKFKGAQEDLYIPDRSLMGRVKAIMSQMTQSKDSIWLEVSKIQ